MCWLVSVLSCLWFWTLRVEGKISIDHRDQFDANMLRLKLDEQKKHLQPMHLEEHAGRRNHGCAVVGDRLIQILGRWAESVESTSIGALDGGRTRLRSCTGRHADLCVLNHVVAVPVASGDNDTSVTVWLPCGFEHHSVGKEVATRVARIVNPWTLEVGLGPVLDVPGGACAALALSLRPGGREDVCSFGGTDGSHDSGAFLDAVRCYNRDAKKWWEPFEPLPVGLDHANAAYITAKTCNKHDPARVIVMNFRTDHYSNMRTEVFASSMLSSKSRRGVQAARWRMVSNDTSSLPRDASGAVVIAQRYIVQFGGVYYCYASSKTGLAEAREVLVELCGLVGCKFEGPLYSDVRGHHIRVDFSEIRAFDVCRRRWFHVGRLPYPVFATQTCATDDRTYTCGGRRGGRVPRSRPNEHAFVGGDRQNTRECDVRINAELEYMIRSAISRAFLRANRENTAFQASLDTPLTTIPGAELAQTLLYRRNPSVDEERRLTSARQRRDEERARGLQRRLMRDFARPPRAFSR